MLGIAQPCPTLEHSHPRRSKEAHLRSELAGLFASVIKVSRKITIEKDNCFAYGQAILCAAKAENINTALPGNFCRRAAEACAGIRKPGPIHVQIEIMQSCIPLKLRATHPTYKQCLIQLIA